jgi:serine/threonine-protein phosphatase 4 regulatory subunit 1
MVPHTLLTLDEMIFNEYTIDDTLDGVTRLEKYHTSEFSLQRLVLVRDLYDTAIETGYKDRYNPPLS